MQNFCLLVGPHLSIAGIEASKSCYINLEELCYNTKQKAHALFEMLSDNLCKQSLYTQYMPSQFYWSILFYFSGIHNHD